MESLVEKLNSVICGKYTAKEPYGRGIDTGLQIAMGIAEQHQADLVARLEEKRDSLHVVLDSITRRSAFDECIAIIKGEVK